MSRQNRNRISQILKPQRISPFGLRLKEAFENAGNSKIAKQLKVSNPTVTIYMSGRIPPPDKLLEISDLTKCNLHWLLTGVGEKKLKPADIENKNVSQDSNQPTTLLFHSDKGGIGTTTAAIFTAYILAKKGKRVLLVDDGTGSCSFVFSSAKDKNDSPEGPIYSDKKCIFQAEIPNLEIYLPFRTRIYSKSVRNKSRGFRRNDAGVKKKYDYIVVDTKSHKTPFTDNEHPLIYFIREAKVLIPYQQSIMPSLSIEKTLEDMNDEREKYPQVDLLGIIEFDLISKELLRSQGNQRNLKEIHRIANCKVFETSIHFDYEASNLFSGNPTKLFNCKCGIVDEFERLVEEFEICLEINSRTN